MPTRRHAGAGGAGGGGTAAGRGGVSGVGRPPEAAMAGASAYNPLVATPQEALFAPYRDNEQ